MSTVEPSRPFARSPVNRPKKRAMILAQRMVAEIADGRLEEGSPLPAEREMLEDYGVARGTLREALRFLEIQGVITIKTGPGGGPVVGEPGSRHVASVIAMMLQLERAPFRAVLEARTTLEPAMAAQAALRISAEELEKLHASVKRMRAHLDDLDFFLHENEAFHDIIAARLRQQRLRPADLLAQLDHRRHAAGRRLPGVRTRVGRDRARAHPPRHREPRP